MTKYEDMTYDEQRAMLGLWRPTPTYLLERSWRIIAEPFRLLASLLVTDVRDKSGYPVWQPVDDQWARGDRR